MKSISFIVVILLSFSSFSQLKTLKLRNAVVIGQFDKEDERFTIESTMTGLLTEFNIKTAPSVNYLKTGEPLNNISNDSLMNVLKEKGFDTYVIVSVRGYDRSYKPSTIKYSFVEKLAQGTLREIYRNAAVSVTFEFAFYRNGEMVAIDQVKCNNISDKESVLKRFVKKTEKRIATKWR